MNAELLDREALLALARLRAKLDAPGDDHYWYVCYSTGRLRLGNVGGAVRRYVDAAPRLPAWEMLALAKDMNDAYRAARA